MRIADDPNRIEQILEKTTALSDRLQLYVNHYVLIEVCEYEVEDRVGLLYEVSEYEYNDAEPIDARDFSNDDRTLVSCALFDSREEALAHAFALTKRLYELQSL